MQCILPNFRNCWSPKGKGGLEYRKQKGNVSGVSLAKIKAFLTHEGPFPKDENKWTFPCLSQKGMNAEILKMPCYIFCQTHEHTIWDAGGSGFTKIISKKGKPVIKVGCPPVRLSGPKNSISYGLRTFGRQLGAFLSASNTVQWRALIAWNTGFIMGRFLNLNLRECISTELKEEESVAPRAYS